jgi:hypothetical protein
MISLEELIIIGNETLEKKTMDIVEKNDAVTWIQLSITYIHRVIRDKFQLRLFNQIVDKQVDVDFYFVHQIKALIGILEACKKIPNEYRDIDDRYVVLTKMLNNFHSFVSTSKRRYNNRIEDCNKFQDEYDIQDAIHSILMLLFNNVKREDYVPSRGGANSRIDFHIPEIKTGLEIKFSSGNHKDKSISEEISVDIQRYKGNTLIEKIIFFVYDPQASINNVGGLKELEDNNIEIIIKP